MAYGFRARNPNTGYIQIDETYNNWALRSVQLLTLSPGSGFHQGIINLGASDRGCFAWRSDQPAFLMGRNSSGHIFRSIADGRPPANIWIYTFDDPAFGQMYGGNYGLRVRNGGGGVTFDSRMKYMRWIDEISGDNLGNQISLTRTYGGAVVPAVIQGNLCYDIHWEALGVGTVVPFAESFQVQGVHCSGSSVVWTPLGYLGPQTYSPPSVPPGKQTAYSYTIIDVAGL